MAPLTPLMKPKAAFILRERSQSTLPMPWLGIPGLLFSEVNEASECRGGAAIFYILLNNSMPTHFLQSSCGGHCARCRVASLSANDCCVYDTEGRLRTLRRRSYILHLAEQQHANAFAATKLQWTLCPGQCGTLQHLLQCIIPVLLQLRLELQFQLVLQLQLVFIAYCLLAGGQA
jgi:hypothetical protein